MITWERLKLKSNPCPLLPKLHENFTIAESMQPEKSKDSILVKDRFISQLDENVKQESHSKCRLSSGSV